MAKKPKKRRLQVRKRKVARKVKRLPKGTARRKRKKSLLKRTIAAIKRLNKKLRARAKARRSRAHLRPGPPGWAGGKRIINQEVKPLVPYAVTSAKRRETFGNPSSDHFVLNLFSFAKDFATGNNYALAQKIKRELTGDPRASYRDGESFLIRRFGYTYRVQIIAGTHGTGPHLHVGIRRV